MAPLSKHCDLGTTSSYSTGPVCWHRECNAVGGRSIPQTSLPSFQGRARWRALDCGAYPSFLSQYAEIPSWRRLPMDEDYGNLACSQEEPPPTGYFNPHPSAFCGFVIRVANPHRTHSIPYSAGFVKFSTPKISQIMRWLHFASAFTASQGHGIPEVERWTNVSMPSILASIRQVSRSSHLCGNSFGVPIGPGVPFDSADQAMLAHVAESLVKPDHRQWSFPLLANPAFHCVLLIVLG